MRKLFLSAVGVATTIGMLFSGAVASAANQVMLYDGMTYQDLKSILGTTKLSLKESETAKGNKYLTVTVPGSNVDFVATTANCGSGQSNPCLGFSFIWIAETGKSPSAEERQKFSEMYHFARLDNSIGGNEPLVSSFFLASGGVTAKNVLSGASIYFESLYDYLSKRTVVAANGQAPTTVRLGMPNAGQSFAQLSARPMAPVPYAGAGSFSLDQVIDATVAPRR